MPSTPGTSSQRHQKAGGTHIFHVSQESLHRRDEVALHIVRLEYFRYLLPKYIHTAWQTSGGQRQFRKIILYMELILPAAIYFLQQKGLKEPAGTPQGRPSNFAIYLCRARKHRLQQCCRTALDLEQYPGCPSRRQKQSKAPCILASITSCRLKLRVFRTDQLGSLMSVANDSLSSCHLSGPMVMTTAGNEKAQYSRSSASAL